MAMGIAGKAVTVWFGILLLAIANGLFREAVLVPQLGSAPGLLVSGLLLSLFILVVAYLSLPWLGRGPAGRFVGIGLGWLGLTLGFEAGFGLLVEGRHGYELFAAYTFEGGNLWPVVLLVTAAAPYLAARARGWL